MDAGSGGSGGLSATLEARPRAATDSLCQAVQAELPEYRILKSIKQGGQGAIYLAHQVGTERKVAIKVLPPTLEVSDGHPVVREAKALGRIDHPHVVTIHASGEVNGYAYLVMQFIDGEPMDEALPVLRAGVHELAAMFAKVCRAVAAAHERNIMHCDIKPGNVLVSDDGQPHVLDFGLARLASPASPSSSHTPGTLPWMSPEQLRYRNYVLDQRTDIYSMGVLFYWVLSGEMPYGVDRPSEVTPEMIWDTEPQALYFLPGVDDEDEPAPARRVARDLEMIIFKSLEKNPDDRYASAAAMADDLERYVRGEAVSVEGMGWRYRLVKKIKRYRVAIAITLLTVGLLGAGAVAWSSRVALQISRAATEMASLNDQAGVYRDEGDIGSAHDAYARSVSIASDVHGDDRAVRRFEFDALRGLAEMYYMEERPDDAERYRRDAYDLVQRMLSTHPDDETWVRAAALSHVLEGRAANSSKMWREAASAFRSATNLRRVLVRSNPDDLGLRRNLASSLQGVAIANQRLGEFDVAMEAYAEAEILLQANLDHDPAGDVHLIRLAMLDNYVATWHLAQSGCDHTAAALARLDQALMHLEGVKRRRRQTELLRSSIAQNRSIAAER